MENENNLIDSLLKEHAKSKGVDEKFLSELEAKLDGDERGNVIPLERGVDKSGVYGWKRGLGVGVAACAALCVAGTMLWRSGDKPEEIVLDSGSASRQIANAKESLHELEGKPKVSYGKTLEEEGGEDLHAEMALESELKTDSSIKKRGSKPAASASKLSASIASSTPMTVPMPAPEKVVEPSLDFGHGDDFGDGWGGGSGAGAGGGGVARRDKDLTKRQSAVNGMHVDGEITPSKRRLADFNAERYGELVENEFTTPVDKESRRSTFAVDVDTASYANLRRLINNRERVPADSVRIEELVNYFDYQYEQPGQTAKHPFAVHVDAADCPWNENSKLVRIALQGKNIVRADRPASNVVFLLDVSGSMNSADKLPLLKESLEYLLEELNEKDTISIVVYAGASGVVLPATKVDGVGRVKIIKAMEKLSAGGSTAGGAGIKLAYKLAQENFIKGGVNRVILATDGDFNVGVSDPSALTDLVKQKAQKGVEISVLGFGKGNLNDRMLEMITNNGNGNYNYIDTIKEGRKVLLEDMMGTMVTIAKDVKIQVEFNPARVKEYRLIGYSNRMLPNAAFLDKKADAGEIGAGHRVTAFYEIVPGKAVDKSKLDELRYGDDVMAEADVKRVESVAKHTDELLFVKLAYKQPEQKINDESTYLAVPLKNDVKTWDRVDEDFKFGASVALFGMVLRDSEYKGGGDMDLVQKLAESGKGVDGKGLRGEFINLVKKVKERE
ncbi:MAG: vWA domain-containing protein [Akkermansiaceae bacterium]